MSVSETLYKAADHVERFGHQKGRGHGDGDVHTAPACVIGAINLAADGLDGPDARGAISAVKVYIDDQCIPFWNDEPSRTQAEVVEALRAAAIIAGAQSQPVRVYEAAR